MEELKGEVMSKKNLYEEVITRMIRRSNLPLIKSSITSAF